jgi:hypothetical protein
VRLGGRLVRRHRRPHGGRVGAAGLRRRPVDHRRLDDHDDDDAADHTDHASYDAAHDNADHTPHDNADHATDDTAHDATDDTADHAPHDSGDDHHQYDAGALRSSPCPIIHRPPPRA